MENKNEGVLSALVSFIFYLLRTFPVFLSLTDVMGAGWVPELTWILGGNSTGKWVLSWLPPQSSVVWTQDCVVSKWRNGLDHQKAKVSGGLSLECTMILEIGTSVIK